ncbi:Uncharacterised protein [Fluoribacter dumoffii]|uniref:Uncharacterized protein n=1 Tax=Fluoribacter dumoffii TaxID=463 RepID=A0A377GES1_9GAMM|nr:Uncharacterised protein [Fluoribacter dumoffii]
MRRKKTFSWIIALLVLLIILAFFLHGMSAAL